MASASLQACRALDLSLWPHSHNSVTDTNASSIGELSMPSEPSVYNAGCCLQGEEDRMDPIYLLVKGFSCCSYSLVDLCNSDSTKAPPRSNAQPDSLRKRLTALETGTYHSLYRCVYPKP